MFKLFMVELAVTNLEESLTWYQRHLGLKLLLHDEAGAFALLEAGNAKLALKQRPVVVVSAELVFEVAELDRRLGELKTAGVNVLAPPVLSAEGYREACIADPNGHSIRLFEWTQTTVPSHKNRADNA